MKSVIEKIKGLYIIQPPKRERRKDWRKYVIPTKSKRKRNISENHDRFLYGA